MSTKMTLLQKKVGVLIKLSMLVATAGCAAEVADDAFEEEPSGVQDVAVTEMKLATPQCTSVGQELGPFGHIFVPVASNGSSNCWLDRGSYGPAVGALQDALNACWFKDLDSDNDYGRLTQQAVREVQASLNITADGVYGPQTRRHMGQGFATLLGNCGAPR